MTILTNSDIIKGLQTDDRATIQYVYKRIGPKVLGYVLNNSGSREDADEVLQIALMKAWRNVKEGKFDGRSSFEVYFFNIVVHTWIDELRRRKRQYTHEMDESWQLGEDSFEAIYQNALKNEQVNVLHSALKKLGDICQKVITLFYFEDKATKDIATQEGVADNVIRKRLFDCRERLRILAQEEMKGFNPSI